MQVLSFLQNEIHVDITYQRTMGIRKLDDNTDADSNESMSEVFLVLVGDTDQFYCKHISSEFTTSPDHIIRWP